MQESKQGGFFKQLYGLLFRGGFLLRGRLRFCRFGLRCGFRFSCRCFDRLGSRLGGSLRYRFTDHLGIEARYQYSALSITKNTGSGTYFLFRSNKGCFHNLVSFALSYTF